MRFRRNRDRDPELVRREEERRLLEEELCAVREQLRDAYRSFNLVTDPDLIEAWTYEISAQRARYSYLLRQWKETAPGRAMEEAGA